MKRLILCILFVLVGATSVQAETNPYHDAQDAVRLALAQARATGDCRAAFELGVEEAELNRFLAWANQVPERRIVETRFGKEETSTGTVYYVLVLEQPRPNQYRLVALPLRRDRSRQWRLVQLSITPTGSLEETQGNIAFLLLGGRSRFDPQRSPRSGPWPIQSLVTPAPPSGRDQSVAKPVAVASTTGQDLVRLEREIADREQKVGRTFGVPINEAPAELQQIGRQLLEATKARSQRTFARLARDETSRTWLIETWVGGEYPSILADADPRAIRVKDLGSGVFGITFPVLRESIRGGTYLDSYTLFVEIQGDNVSLSAKTYNGEGAKLLPW